MDDQLDHLPKLHKSTLKKLMPKMSPKVENEFPSSSSKLDIITDEVAVDVQDVIDAEEVLDDNV